MQTLHAVLPDHLYREAMMLVKEGWFRDEQELIREKATQNRYQVTDEFSYTNGLHTNRYDVVFLVNGIPLFFVETKAVAKFFRRRVHQGSIIAEALTQIHRYHRQTPEALTLLELYTATFEQLGPMFGISECYACKVYHRYRDILVKLIRLPSWKCLLAPGVEAIVLDVTEQPIERPTRKQRRYYSGKKNDIQLKPNSLGV